MIFKEIIMVLHIGGKVFNELTVIERAGRTHSGKTLWKCLCFCGKETVKITNEIVSGKVKSCGCCEWHIHHFEAYNSWQSARQRCFNPKNKDYEGYGGRGITMCERWESFTNFYRDMGDPPKDNITGERLSLDRKNVDGNYEPNNCKWSDRSEQQLNKR